MRVTWCWIGLLLPLAGCGPQRTPYPAALQSERPEERILAVKHAADVRDQNAIPALVERLEDDDEAVRFYAILALDRLTGTRLGYDYQSVDTERWRAVERWRSWVRERAAATQPASMPSVR